MKRKLHYIATGRIKKAIPKYCPGYGVLKGKCNVKLKRPFFYPEVPRQELCTKCSRQKTTDALASLLESPTGMHRIASAMANPIRQQLDYQSVARRAMVVEPIPEGALPIFNNTDEEREERILVPEFEITSNMKLSIKDEVVKPKFKNRKLKTIAKCQT